MIKRGDIFWVDLNPVQGSEQAGRRPILIIQNNISNEFARTVIAAPLTTSVSVKEYPTRVFLPKGTGGLKADSTALLSQIRVLDKSRLEQRIGHISAAYMIKVDAAMKTSLALS
jgi:mRNA interferase MazF